MTEISTHLSQKTDARAAATRWAAIASLGYAGLLVTFRALLAAQTDVPLLTPKFLIQVVAVALTGMLLRPVFLILSRRPGFREGVGSYLGLVMVSLFVAVGFLAALTATQPGVQVMLAHLVSAAPLGART